MDIVLFGPPGARKDTQAKLTMDLLRISRISTQETMKRRVGRRGCEKCGQIFHLRYNPPPSPDSCGCGGKFMQRQDDTDEVVRKHDEYLAKTAPLLDYYGAKGLVKAVNGIGSLEEVTERIKTVVGAG